MKDIAQTKTRRFCPLKLVKQKKDIYLFKKCPSIWLKKTNQETLIIPPKNFMGMSHLCRSEYSGSTLGAYSCYESVQENGYFMLILANGHHGVLQSFVKHLSVAVICLQSCPLARAICLLKKIYTGAWFLYHKQSNEFYYIQ